MTISETDTVQLLGPGPSNVSQGVLNAMARPTLGHLDPAFLALMDDLKADLATLMKAGDGLTLPVSGTGSAGMEAAIVNIVEPGDPVLVCVNGVFGGRMKEVATRLGADVDAIEFEWGTPVVPERVAEALAKKQYKLVGCVHAETSTGVASPVNEIGKLVRPTGALFLVDCVTSLAGMDFDRDGWLIDLAYSGTQKCLSCPPGLAPLTFNERALEVIRNRQTKVPNWYLDVSLLLNYYTGQKRQYHHTAPINMIFGLHQAVKEVLLEGVESVWSRHQAAHEALVAGLSGLGLEMYVAEGFRLPMLNAVKVPEGVDEAAVRTQMRNEFLSEIGAGLGPLAGKIWRIGLMGTNARTDVVERLLGDLRKCL